MGNKVTEWLKGNLLSRYSGGREKILQISLLGSGFWIVLI